MRKILGQNNKKNKGFTLIETLVAISIFTMSILSVMSILAGGISDTNYAKKRLTAEYLAQEGIEEIRNIRDTYVLYVSGGGWTNFNSVLSASCASASGCYFDNSLVVFNSPSSMPITNVQFIPCGPSGCTDLLFDSTGGNGYQYNNTGTGTFSDSGLSRSINTTQIGPDEIRVTSTVSWKQGSGNPFVSFSENLYNWTQ